jgi:hypothetical protein
VEELEELPESLKELPTVLVVWLEVYQRWQKWSEARRQTVIRRLEVEPEEPSWPVALAYATRRSRGLVLANEVLLPACEKFPHSTNFVTLVS